MSKIKFSLIASAVLVLSSFVPVIQILILTLNGAFVSMFTSSNSVVIQLVNGVATLLMFLLFYFSSSVVAKLFSLLGVLIFFMPFLFYATENRISTDRFYFLQFLIVGIITGIMLIGVEYFRSKKVTQ